MLSRVRHAGNMLHCALPGIPFNENQTRIGCTLLAIEHSAVLHAELGSYGFTLLVMQ